MHPNRPRLNLLRREAVQNCMCLQVLPEQLQQYPLEIATVDSCKNLFDLDTADVVFVVNVEAEQPRVEFLLGNI